MAVQAKEKTRSKASETAQRVSSSPYVEDQRPSQLKKAQLQDAIAQREENSGGGQGAESPAAPSKTGLPDTLKSGIESMSGYSMDDVQVHYNSPKPAALNAHAYAQGTDIHLAGGQEQHLPHEAWHVVQQAQGRVQPTAEVGGQAINDDAVLEQEADVMWARAAQSGGQEASSSAKSAPNQGGAAQRQVIQRKTVDEEAQEKKAQKRAKFEAAIRPQLVIIEGHNSVWNRIRNTTFNQLINAAAAYNAAEADKKDAALDQVKNLGEQWLSRHKEIKSADEQIKHKSITALVNTIDGYHQEVAEAAKDEFVKPQTVDTTPDDAGEKVESTSTFMEKATEVVTGNDPIYSDIIKHYTAYQNEYVKVASESASTGLKMLAEVASKSQEILDKIKEWHGKHSVDGFLASAVEHVLLDYERKSTMLSQIQSHLNVFKFSVDLSDQVTVRGANIPTTALDKPLTNLGIQVALPKGQVYEAQNFGMEVDKGTVKFADYSFAHAVQLNNEVKLKGSSVVLKSASAGVGVDIQAKGDVGFDAQPAHTTGDFTNAFTEVSLTEANTWALPTKKYRYVADIDNDLHYESSLVSITEGSAIATEADLDLTIHDKMPHATGKASNVKMSTAGFGWKKSALDISGGYVVNKLVELADISVAQEGMHTGYKRTVTSGNVKLSLNKGPIDASISDGEVSVSKSVSKPDWFVSSFALDFGFEYENLFSCTANRAIYSDSEKKLSLKSLTVTLKSDVLPGLENSSAELEDLVIQDKGGTVETDFKKITIKKPASTFKPVEGVSYTTPPEVSLTKLAKGKYKLAIGDSTLDIKAGNWLDANATASAEFTYDAGQKDANSSLITVKTATITLGSALSTHLKGLKGDVDTLTIASGFKGKDDPVNGIDWKKITVTNPKDGAISFGGPVTVTPPKKAEILSPKLNYKTTLTGATGTADIPGMQAKGAVNFSFDSTGKVSLEEGSLLEVSGSTGTLPPKIPGWPVSLTMPIPLGVPGIEANVSFEAGGGVKLGYTLELKYEKKEANPALALKGNMNATGEIFANISIGAGVGSSLVVYAGVYAETGAKATVSGAANLEGRFVQKDESFEAESLKAGVEMKGNLTASLKFGAEARALYFFRKKLYEFEVAEWKIGEASKTMTYHLMGSSDESKYAVDEGTGVMSPSGQGVSLPDLNAAKEKNEGKGLDEISKNLTGYSSIDSAKAEIATIIDGENGSLRKTSPEHIDSIKVKVTKAAQDLLADVKKRDYNSFLRFFGFGKEEHKQAKQAEVASAQLQKEAENLSKYIADGDLVSIQKLNQSLSNVVKFFKLS